MEHESLDFKQFKIRILGILEKVSKIPIHDNELDGNSSFSDVLLFDSITMIEFIIEIEDEFDITFNDEDIDFEQFDSINSIFTLISSISEGGL